VSAHLIGSPKSVIDLGSMKPSPARAIIIAVLFDSPFTQLPFMIVEVRFDVVDEKRRLAGRGYDGRFFRVKG
jgi:hypothetical protein